MKLHIYIWAGLLLQYVLALGYSPRQQIPPKVVSAPLRRRYDTYNVQDDLRRREYLRRRQTVSQTLDNQASKQGYYANSACPLHIWLIKLRLEHQVNRCFYRSTLVRATFGLRYLDQRSVRTFRILARHTELTTMYPVHHINM